MSEGPDNTVWTQIPGTKMLINKDTTPTSYNPKVSLACDACRRSKRKCTGGPLCKRCAKQHLQCTFLDTRRRKRSGENQPNENAYGEDFEHNQKKQRVDSNKPNYNFQPQPLQSLGFNSSTFNASDMEAAYQLFQNFIPGAQTSLLQYNNANSATEDLNNQSTQSSIIPVNFNDNLFGDPNAIFELLFSNQKVEVTFNAGSSYFTMPTILKVPPELFEQWMEFFFNLPPHLTNLMFSREDVTPPWRSLEYQLLSCLVCLLSARALGHWDLVDQLEQEARLEASAIFDKPSRESAIAFCILSGYYSSWEPRRATYYAKLAVAQSQELLSNDASKHCEKSLAMVQLICCMILMMHHPNQSQLASIAITMNDVLSRDVVKSTSLIGPEPPPDLTITNKTEADDLILLVLTLTAEMRKELTEQFHKQGLKPHEASKLVLTTDAAMDMLAKCDTMYSISLRLDVRQKSLNEFYIGSMKTVLYWSIGQKMASQQHMNSILRMLLRNKDSLPLFVPPVVLEIIEAMSNIAEAAQNTEILELLKLSYDIFKERSKIPNKAKVFEISTPSSSSFDGDKNEENVNNDALLRQSF